MGGIMGSRADLDGPVPTLLSDSDDDPHIIYAVFGGIDNGAAICKDVTEKVGKLLHDSNKGFFAHAEDLGINCPDDPAMSLIILYNHNGHRHLFVRQHNGPKLSMGLLREAARIDDSQETEVPIATNASELDSDVHVMFAAYGVHEAYLDVTDKVGKLTQEPKGFIADDNSMGCDPESGSAKMLLVIYDCKGKRQVFAGTTTQSIRADEGVLAAMDLKPRENPSAVRGNPGNPPPPKENKYKPGDQTPFGH